MVRDEGGVYYYYASGLSSLGLDYKSEIGVPSYQSDESLDVTDTIAYEIQLELEFPHRVPHVVYVKPYPRNRI
jgi:hypothetical protein